MENIQLSGYNICPKDCVKCEFNGGFNCLEYKIYPKKSSPSIFEYSSIALRKLQDETCNQNIDCENDFVCSEGACVECANDIDCGGDDECIDNQCVSHEGEC